MDDQATCKAIFVKEFHWHRPKSPLGFAAKPGDAPQSFPRDFIDAAIKCGAAVAVPKAKSGRGSAPKSGE